MIRLLRILVVSFFTTLAARVRRGPACPTWGFQFEWVVAFLRKDFDESAHWPYVRLRQDLDARHYPSKALGQVTRETTSLGGLPAVWFRPKQARRGAILLLHGGSYIFGSIRTSHAELAASLALLSGVPVVGIDYRLAPEHPYPAALDDALAAFDALLQSGLAASEIVLAGDSAGGNLALSLQLRLRDRQRPQARAAVLLSPWLDLSASRPSCRARDSIDYGQTWFLLQHARDFAGELSLDDPRISPLNANLVGLAPLLVVIGGAERLADEGRELVEKARASGVLAELWVAADMPHNPPVLAAFHANAQQSLRASAQYATKLLSAQIE
ncbi:MAG TPA: alpha/beta hydrolase fold domain-containing protein [Polyangiaceae bacterium]|nr:alpha/beta hydrolase fold domain-containing protein [Polyangiaceae bacterium]